jgi:L-2-hydroxyglutarate oxidase LhgO
MTITLNPTETIHSTEEDNFDGWFCVQTTIMLHCVCGNFAAPFLTYAHIILVWEEKDDPVMLEQAQTAKEKGTNPKIVEYKEEFGPAIPYDKAHSDPTLIPHR